MKFRKKGQVGGLQGFILSIITVAIVLAIGLIVMNELQETAKVLDTETSLNETVAQGDSVSQNPLFISASACRNITNEINIPLGIDCNVSSTGVVSLNPENGSSARIDYTYWSPNAAFNSSRTIITKLATIPTWIGIIIIVALAFIVLSFFIGKRQ